MHCTTVADMYYNYHELLINLHDRYLKMYPQETQARSKLFFQWQRPFEAVDLKSIVPPNSAAFITLLTYFYK